MLKPNLHVCLHNLLLSKTADEEKKIAKHKLTSANEDVVNLKKIIARLEGELHVKDKVQSDLVSKLEEVKN